MGYTATTDVGIAVNNNAMPLVMVTMMGMSEAIAVMATMTILLTKTPANITISWAMTTNDDNNHADNGNDGKESLPSPMMATTAEMVMGMMGGGSLRTGSATIS